MPRLTRILLQAGLILSALSASAGWAKPAAQGAVPALYPTRAEAEKAAHRFHCQGAHKMGDQWMPCAKHSDHGSVQHPPSASH